VALTAQQRTLPVLEPFAGLLPHGALQRGSTVGCSGSASVSLAMALVAGAVQQHGSWVAVAGMSGFGVRAAVELGISAERVVLVAEPAGGFDDGQWADIVAAMIDGFDVVVLASGARRIRPAVARRLQARAQSRGAVLVTVGVLDGFVTDVQLTAERSHWTGLAAGHGVVTARRLDVEVGGRRVPGVRRATLWLPDIAGQVRLAEQEPIPLRRTG